MEEKRKFVGIIVSGEPVQVKHGIKAGIIKNQVPEIEKINKAETESNGSTPITD